MDTVPPASDLVRPTSDKRSSNAARGSNGVAAADAGVPMGLSVSVGFMA